TKFTTTGREVGFGEVWSILASLWEGAAKGMITSFIIHYLGWQAARGFALSGLFGVVLSRHPLNKTRRVGIPDFATTRERGWGVLLLAPSRQAGSPNQCAEFSPYLAIALL